MSGARVERLEPVSDSAEEKSRYRRKRYRTESGAFSTSQLIPARCRRNDPTLMPRRDEMARGRFTRTSRVAREILMLGVVSHDTSLDHDGTFVEAAPEHEDNGNAPSSSPCQLGGHRPLFAELRQRPASRRKEGAASAMRRRSNAASKSRAGAMVRFLYLTAIAIVTVVVCGGISAPLRTVTSSFAPPVDAAVADDGGAEQWAQTSAPSRGQKHAATPAAIDLCAEETDLDDDESWRFDLFATRHPTKVAAPRGTESELRGELSIETSRLTIRTGTPRGPPA